MLLLTPELLRCLFISGMLYASKLFLTGALFLEARAQTLISSLCIGQFGQNYINLPIHDNNVKSSMTVLKFINMEKKITFAYNYF